MLSFCLLGGFREALLSWWGIVVEVVPKLGAFSCEPSVESFTGKGAPLVSVVFAGEWRGAEYALIVSIPYYSLSRDLKFCSTSYYIYYARMILDENIRKF